MKARKTVLGILISTFLFVAIHDFIIGYIDPDTQVELYMHKIEQVPLCESSSLHEHVHNTMMTTVEYIESTLDHHTKKIYLTFEEINQYIFFNYNRLDRPPIV